MLCGGQQCPGTNIGALDDLLRGVLFVPHDADAANDHRWSKIVHAEDQVSAAIGTPPGDVEAGSIITAVPEYGADSFAKLLYGRVMEGDRFALDPPRRRRIVLGIVEVA